MSLLIFWQRLQIGLSGRMKRSSKAMHSKKEWTVSLDSLHPSFGDWLTQFDSCGKALREFGVPLRNPNCLRRSPSESANFGMHLKRSSKVFRGLKFGNRFHNSSSRSLMPSRASSLSIQVDWGRPKKDSPNDLKALPNSEHGLQICSRARAGENWARFCSRYLTRSRAFLHSSSI